MHNYINGDRPTGVVMFGKVINHQMTRIYFKGDSALVTKLTDRLKQLGVFTEIPPDRKLKEEGWMTINFSALDENLQMSTATTVMRDDFAELEIATNENA